MITVGLDDTDTLDSPGTNRLAKAIVKQLADRFECRLIVRHQLLDDPRVPYTSKNGSASIRLRPIAEDLQSASARDLCDLVFEEFRSELARRFVEGSDPGLCVTSAVPEEITAFGRLCQQEVVSQKTARGLAVKHRIRLEGLGGTEDGVVGALAAIGLAAGRNDGRIVQLGTWPDDLSEWHPVERMTARNVVVRDLETGRSIREGMVDVGKHLRPNFRDGQIVLYVRRDEDSRDLEMPRWKAVRFP